MGGLQRPPPSTSLPPSPPLSRPAQSSRKPLSPYPPRTSLLRLPSLPSSGSSSSSGSGSGSTTAPIRLPASAGSSSLIPDSDVYLFASGTKAFVPSQHKSNASPSDDLTISILVPNQASADQKNPPSTFLRLDCNLIRSTIVTA